MAEDAAFVERYVPGETEGDIELEHVHRYLLAWTLVTGKRVLDVACGEGYGAEILARSAKSVVGVDIDTETIASAQTRHRAANLRFITAPATALPLPDAAVDVVVSFETLEHLSEHDEMLSEIVRVLVPGGLLVMSTPDRDRHSQIHEHENPYHLRELSRSELSDLLARHFKFHKLVGQHVDHASIVGPLDPEMTSFVDFTSGEDGAAVDGLDHVYLIALASDAPLPALPASTYAVRPEARLATIQSLESQIASVVEHRDGIRTKLTRVTAERDALAAMVDPLRDLADSQAELINTFMNSTSWRITAPARNLFRAIREHGSVRGYFWRAAKGIYHGAPIAPAHKLRLRASGVRVWMAAQRPLVALARRRRRQRVARGPRRVSFPLPGYITVHPEIEAATQAVLDTSVSVVIPTYNAGPEFYWLLRKLRTQKGLRELEIVTVDSGSTDDTVRLARDAGCTVAQIPKEDFDHSYSRNLGADKATGDHLLFMGQDTYPVGDYWIYGLVRALTTPVDGRELAAVSCVEFPRSDSELLYDAITDVHYRFVGAADGDRLGRLSGHDHAALRSQGHLGDTALMVSRALFLRYRYEGKYAEDLKFGIRLIKDGHTIGMLSSIKVIHSHNRAAHYYLRRSFTDTTFLSETFADYPIARVKTLIGPLIGARLAADLVTGAGVLARPVATPSAHLSDLAARLRSHAIPPSLGTSEPPDFALPTFGSWASREMTDRRADGADLSRAERDDARDTLAAIAARLDSMESFVARVYTESDATVEKHVRDAAWKAVAASLGNQFGLAVLSSRMGTNDLDAGKCAELEQLLLAGV